MLCFEYYLLFQRLYPLGYAGVGEVGAVYFVKHESYDSAVDVGGAAFEVITFGIEIAYEACAGIFELVVNIAYCVVEGIGH